ncbi:hypothetical protein Pmani_021806 [Petrolisthes manimaculis]|uniref:Uncharacterized protein n=1 Tax=Petrolisthes manimaculis TaxID=1843537 RepID=A0AAE1U4Y1_9EUCA|nr:hypothetical protein Pmani_021806 [Petrolisthes manimaculis]
MHHHPLNRERALNLSILPVSGPDEGNSHRRLPNGTKTTPALAKNNNNKVLAGPAGKQTNKQTKTRQEPITLAPREVITAFEMIHVPPKRYKQRSADTRGARRPPTLSRIVPPFTEEASNLPPLHRRLTHCHDQQRA